MSEHRNVATETRTVDPGPIALSPDPVRELLTRTRGIVVGAEAAAIHYNELCEQYDVLLERLEQAHETLGTTLAILRASARGSVVTSRKRKKDVPPASQPETATTPPG